jgi:hypothetical protein
MWDAIAYVSGGFTLAAFIVAVAAWVYKITIDKQLQQIIHAPEKDRARLIESTHEFFRVNTEKLSREQKYTVVIRQIEEKANRFKTVARVVVIIAILAAALCVFAIAYDRRTSEPPPTPTPTPTPVVKCEGKAPGGGDAFSVSDNYDPSGHMGDINDIGIEKLPAGSTLFTYKTTGQGVHEWDYTYARGELNRKPARFAGVMYLSSPNNWGQQPGYDLRRFRRTLKWEARSLAGPVNVNFVVGGVNWTWEHTTKEKNYNLPCPDSMPHSQKIKILTGEWQTYEWELSEQPEENFRSVVGGFAWLIEWGANGVQFNEEQTGAANPKEFKIEIRNIRYER